MSKQKKEGQRIGKCECGGEVRGIYQFDRLFTWCETCTSVVKMRASSLSNGERDWAIDGSV